MRRRFLATGLAVLMLGLSGIAQALEIKPFATTTLAELRSAGKPVALHFHADWCPTCVNQSRSFQQLKADAQLQGMTLLVADYDREKDLRREHQVRSQSVLIVFKGADEVARIAGQTRPEQLRQALAKAL